MFKSVITNIEKVRHQETGTDFLDLSFDLVDEAGEVVTSRKLGLDPSSSKEEVEAVLIKYVETFTLEQEQAVTQRELDAVDENVTSLKEELVGKSVGPLEPEPEEDEE